MELSARKDIDVFVTGGHLRGDWFSLVGPAAVASMKSIFVDVVFIGVNGIDAERGLTCFSSDEAEINSVMVQQAKRKVVVTDHSKLGQVARWVICPTEGIDVLITDDAAPESDLALFRQRGVEVRTV